MSRHMLILLLVGCLPAAADPPTLADVRNSFSAKRYEEGLRRAQALLASKPPQAARDGAEFFGGICAVQLRKYALAERYLAAQVGRTPASSYAGPARNWLLQALSRSRKFDACIARCRAFLTRLPKHADRVFWRYLIGESQFRDWRFAEARTELLAIQRDHPRSKYARRIRGMLALIVDRVDADDNGLMAGYRGKFAQDARLKAIAAALPQMLADSRATLKRRLGIELPATSFALIQWADKGTARGATHAETMTMCVAGKPRPLIRFYTEHVVVSRPAFAQRLTHELKHAYFHVAIQQRYQLLPKWIREGLALYGAEQTDDRLAHLLSNCQFTGRDALKRFDGLVRHTSSDDYPEEGLAFEWLERRAPGGAAVVCKALLGGKDHREAFGLAAGMAPDAAIAAAQTHARARAKAALGAGSSEYRALRAEEARQRGAALQRWYREICVPRCKAWLAKYPDHCLVPNVRYRIGRSLIDAGDHAGGRAWLERVIAGGSRRTSVVDDAIYWLGVSYHKTGGADAAARHLGVLLRDWSWTSKGRSVAKKKRWKPAPPEK